MMPQKIETVRPGRLMVVAVMIPFAALRAAVMAAALARRTRRA